MKPATYVEYLHLEMEEVRKKLKAWEWDIIPEPLLKYFQSLGHEIAKYPMPAKKTELTETIRKMTAKEAA